MGSKILLADDSITIQKVVNLTFADEGIEVIAVSNGDMAERRLNDVNPDLVLADIFMPGKNGYELCEAIKQMPQFHDVPVVLLVGAFEPFNEAEARRVKADAHLTKPFESRVLVETVRRLIENSPRPKNQAVATQMMGSLSAPEAPPAPRAYPLPSIDLSAMSAPFPQPESVLADRLPTGNLPDPTPFADSFPATFDFQKPPVTPTPEPVDLLSGFNAFAGAAPTVADLEAAAVTNDFDTGNVFDIDAFAQPLPEEAQALSASPADPLYDSSAGFDPLATITSPDILFSTAAEVPVATNTVVEVDVAQAESLNETPASPLAAIAIEVPASTSSPMPEAAIRSFDTSELEPPVHQAAATLGNEFVHSHLNGAAHHAPQPDHGFAGAPGSAEPTTTSLLSTDEPLGDLLFNDFPPAAYQASATENTPLEFGEPPTTASQAPLVTAAPGEVRSSEASPAPAKATAELSDEEAAHLEVEANRAADLAITMPSSQAEITFSTSLPAEQNSGDSELPSTPANDAASHAFEVVMPSKVEPLEVEAQVASPATFDFHTPSSDATPAFESVTATAHTDELASPAVFQTQAAPPFEEEESSAAQPATAADKFTASDMWATETQFTPISVAPLPVADFSIAPPAENNPAHAAEVEFNPPQQVAQNAAPKPELSQNHSHHQEENSPAEAAMNQQMIDEIVRRVVAQLSESVVREIAWEVVPDCVERVVSNLTREDLSKRL